MDEETYLVTAQERLGTTLSQKLTLDAVLGVGGMAAVYRATHRNGRQFAVKILHPELSRNARVTSRFLAEGRTANRVGHPGAVAAIDEGEDGGVVYLVMELLQGSTLGALADRCAISPAKLIAYIADLLDVLTAAHANGVIHRDIKPDNVFVTTDGHFKLLDFGIARVIEAAAGAGVHTRTGDVMGTPAFLSPEQARGATDEIDERTDLWAVAATAFAILVGRPVHDARNTNEALVMAATVPPAPIRNLRADLPDALADTIDRALSLAPAERFANAAAMRRSLLADRGVGAVSTTQSTLPELAADLAPAAREAPRADRRSGAPTWAIVAVACAALGVGAALVWPSSTASAPRPEGAAPSNVVFAPPPREAASLVALPVVTPAPSVASSTAPGVSAAPPASTGARAKPVPPRVKPPVDDELDRRK